MKELSKKSLKIIAYFSALMLVVHCKSSNQENNQHSENILINQHAYLVNQSKKALIRGYQGPYVVLSKDLTDTLLKSNTTDSLYWHFSGESYAIADFTEISDPGSYVLYLYNGEYSHPINVLSSGAYESLTIQSLKSYYLQRTTIDIPEKYAGKWARKSGHPDTNVIIHNSATNSIQNVGSIISSPGGWYDAGDYNKYIVNSSITVYTLLLAYNSYSDYFNQLDLNIPESDNGIADLLDEVLFNVRWMLTMQDLDGGLYHKLTTESFEDFVMPHEATKQRFVTMKTTSASLDFAASMAYCYRSFSKIAPLKPLADSCLEAAQKAWEWAVENPDVFYVQPPEISTGEYNDSSFVDEWIWAGTELWLSTKESSYFKEDWLTHPKYDYGTPMWDVVQTLGIVSFMTEFDCESYKEYPLFDKVFYKLMGELLDTYKNSPALTSTNYFKWGSNSDIANQSMLAFVAYNHSGDKNYLEMAQAQVDFLMGRNPTGYNYVTGFGYKSPMHIHHRPSGADGIEEPIPGFLVGGPNTIVLTDCADSSKRSQYPAKSFIDEECSFSTNEIAINWNAPLVFLAAAMTNVK